MSHIIGRINSAAAGKEINEENIKRVLEAGGALVDRSKMKALITLIEALKAKPRTMPTGKPAQSPKKNSAAEKPSEALLLKVASLGKPVGLSTPPVEAEALYLYCMGDGAMEASFGSIGIEGNIVYTIPHRDISAVVHKCPPEPYRSEDDETVKDWVMAHQSVVDVSWEKFGTVLPSGFDTIIKGRAAVSAEENLKKWLEENYEKLRENLERVRGRAEVGVQFFWDRKVVAQNLMETSEEIKRLSEEMSEKSPGMAYFYRQKIERALRKELDGKADEYFKVLYGRIKGYADDIRVEKTKRTEGDKQMFVNLSVLIQKDKIKLLGEELAKIKEIKGVDVRFTGPWPPYSFVTST